MSRISLKSRSAKLAIAGLAVAAIAGLSTMAPHSGADFSDQKQGTVSVGTGTLILDAGNTSAADQGTFGLQYTNLAPGQMVTKTFYLRNGGSINGTASLGNPISVQQLPSGLTAADFAKLMVGVNGAAPVAATSLPASFDLGQVNAGAIKKVTLTIGLAQSAGNEWQGKTLKVSATAALKQVN